MKKTHRGPRHGMPHPDKIRTLVLDAMALDNFTDERLAQYIEVLAACHGMLATNAAFTSTIDKTKHAEIERRSKAAWDAGAAYILGALTQKAGI